MIPFFSKSAQLSRTYTAQAGDTLFSVAQKTLGDGQRWPELQALNKQIPPGPRLLTPGTVLKLPAKTAPAEPSPGKPVPAPAPAPESDSTPPAPAPETAPDQPTPTPAPTASAPSAPAAASAPKTYTVQAGDTLYGIAKKTLGDGGRYPEIQSLNQEILPDANKLKVGMVLKLPTGAEAPTAPVQPAPKPTTPSKPAPKPNEAVQGLFYNDRFEKQVALTFDDGPHPVNTPKVLDILKEYGVKGTFFVTGNNAERYPELVKRIVAEGHTLGNHTFAHPDLAKLSEADVLNELSRTQRAVDKALGKHYDLEQVRPPYGSMDAEVKSAIAKGDDTAILWNVDSNDWRYKNDDAKILDNIFSGSSSVYVRGGVILFHDIHPQTVRVLDDVLARLKHEKFTITTTDAFLDQKYSK
jgi:peptidoglycan/xylan/chitin deacetylase (PgdA/CDA1 family)